LATDKCPIEKKKIKSTAEAIEFSKRVAVVYRLISKPIACYEFESVDGSDFQGYEVDVRSAVFEACGEKKGVENFVPRLFTLQVKNNGDLKIDNSEFKFVPLHCPKHSPKY